MSVFLDRTRRGDAHLEWKVRLLSVAAVLGVAGMYFDERWMTLGALLVLLTAMALRFLPSRAPTPPRDADADDDVDDAAD